MMSSKRVDPELHAEGLRLFDAALTKCGYLTLKLTPELAARWAAIRKRWMRSPSFIRS
jgi:hypothetical protein